MVLVRPAGGLGLAVDFCFPVVDMRFVIGAGVGVFGVVSGVVGGSLQIYGQGYGGWFQVVVYLFGRL